MNGDDNDLIEEEEEESADESPAVTLQDFRDAVLAIEDFDTIGALLEDNLEDVFLSFIFLFLLYFFCCVIASFQRLSQKHLFSFRLG